MHSRHHRLSSPGTSRLSAAPNDAAKDGKEKKTANGAADTDDKIFVVMDPACDFLGGGGAFASALWRER